VSLTDACSRLGTPVDRIDGAAALADLLTAGGRDDLAKRLIASAASEPGTGRSVTAEAPPG
jgi:hypothetical protein